MLKHLPNTMTCGNLLCGCIGILLATEGDLITASWLIILAGVLDFGDGLVARMVGVSGPFGKELDSLADVVTFGVLPSFILLELLRSASGNSLNELSYAAFAIAIFGALRLARFNIDTRQTDQFLGVPIPANALVVASLPLMAAGAGTVKPLTDFFLSVPFLFGYIVVMSGLMVSELPLMAFKFKSYGWQGNQIKYGFLIAAVVLFGVLQFAAIPLIILLYILLSVLTNERQIQQVK
ncbi:CDP-diacylglycerol--serine O-phosphatidyltransferase [Fibrivirga algicola]|uniref:CDP-diacylglycerol--serine O-phosphatidyltransferase n=1 Tax=Fibrivirga algicola TaxID=2950420 RepID=A0ABX0QDH3_9BACT|nr:CDP-diacylglycerol--serine O-phosphatidyltransferase [Fibrivirga algicola]NID09142.1 CDP-diacylglycerol--serine O-phosphatidyltransferase [Fibrivirga algicola]